MHIRHTPEAIFTSLLLMSRVWSRPTEVVCGGVRREGDKWFDGCRWCVCQNSGPVCSSSECSILVSQIPPCTNLGSSWLDGCYSCRCHKTGIECIADDACVMQMRSDRFRSYFLSLDGCVQPKDDRCVCGIDSVPSCTAEVIDKNSFPAVTVELTPTFLTSQNTLSHPENINPSHSDRNFQTTNKRPLNYSDINYDKNIESPITNLHSMNGSLPHHQVSSTKMYSKDIPFQNSERSHPAHPLNVSTPHINKKKAERYSQETESSERTESYIMEGQSSGDGYRNPEENTRRSQSYIHDTAADSKLPSLLVVSANLCRWGARWYGGSLRCYCGLDNSITCGDPSFVASRIDGFKLMTIACQEGHIWEDKTSCTECECKISGVVLCKRSPSCLLPFLIKPLSDDTVKDFEISGTSQIHDGKIELTRNEEQNLVWNQTWANIIRKLPLGKTNSVENWNRNIHHSETNNILDASSGDIDETDSKFNTEEANGSGDIKEIDSKLNTLETNGSGDIKETDSKFNTEETNGSGDIKETDSKLNTLETNGSGDIKETDSKLNTLETNGSGDIKETDSKFNTLETNGSGDIKETDSKLNTEETNGSGDIKEIDSKFNTLETNGSGDIKETDSKFNTLETNGSGDIKETDSKLNTEETNGSGDIKETDSKFSKEIITVKAQDNQTDNGQNDRTEDLNIYFTSPSNILNDSNKNPGLSGDLTTRNINHDAEITTQNPSIKEMQSNTISEKSKASDIEAPTKVTMRECKPMSRWIDGCKRCLCDQGGKKHCDDSRCPKAITPYRESPTSLSDCEDKLHNRPVQCPPVNFTLPRDHPVDFNNNLNSTDVCGRFKPGDVYWEDCNICSCTPQGPMCTAKNCT